MLRIISLIAILITLSSFDFLERDGNSNIYLEHRHKEGNHGEYYPPADMPEAYFNDVDMEIVIEAEGYADYYIVEVVSMVSSLTVIYTQIDGYGNTIDVSSLPEGYYQLVITSSNNNQFEGNFIIE